MVVTKKQGRGRYCRNSLPLIIVVALLVEAALVVAIRVATSENGDYVVESTIPTTCVQPPAAGTNDGFTKHTVHAQHTL